MHTVIFVQLARWVAIYHVHSSNTRYDDSSYLHVLLMVAFCSLYLDCSCFVKLQSLSTPISWYCLELSDLNVLLVWSRQISSIAPAAARSVCSANSSYPSSTSPIGSSLSLYPSWSSIQWLSTALNGPTHHPC